MVSSSRTLVKNESTSRISIYKVFFFSTIFLAHERAFNGEFINGQEVKYENLKLYL